MSDSSKASNSGISTTGLLFIAFLVLKLTHVIAWSWWWITAPLWLPLIVIFGMLAVVAVCAAWD